MRFSEGPTIGDRLGQTKDRPSGFDYLRITLAVAVAIWHIPQNAYGETWFDVEVSGWLSLSAGFLLPSFFALSGFLVAGSLERCRTTSAFVGLRMIRIFPALAVETTLSALLVGPLLSTFSLANYLTDAEFRQYFLNVVGEIHFVLPGVFADTPEQYIVNRQLWTIPYELICYVMLTMLVAIGLRTRRILAPSLMILTTALFLIVIGVLHKWQWGCFNASGIGFRSGFYLVCSFLWGLIFYLYRNDIRLNVFTIVLALTIMTLSTVSGGPYLIFYPLAAAYLTVAIGLSNLKRIWILQGADYSYGIYLYHYVIFQIVAQFYPNEWHAIAGIGLPLTVLFAAFSWHLVEKPAMALRKPLMTADRDSTVGNALLISAVTAATILGFVVSYNFYPFLNP